MQVKSIAKCILKYFRHSLSYHFCLSCLCFLSISERSLKTGFIVKAINSLNKTHTQLEQQLTINQHNNQINALEYIAAETTLGNCVRAFLYLPDNIIYKSITLMYYNRLHAWWLTRLATFLSSSIARRWVGLQTL